MLFKSSLIILVRPSLFFICFSCRVFRNRAIPVLIGIAKTMTSTPTKAGQPKIFQRLIKARMIYRCIISALLQCSCMVEANLERPRDHYQHVCAKILHARSIDGHQIDDIATNGLLIVTENKGFAINDHDKASANAGAR